MKEFESRQDVIKLFSNILQEYLTQMPKEKIFENLDAVMKLLGAIEFIQKQEREFLWEENKRLHNEIEVLSRKRREIQQKVYDLEDELNTLSNDDIARMQ